MVGGDMYEFPDGTVGSNAGDCAQAWADEAHKLRAEVEALRNQICGFKHLDDLRICMFETADKNEALRKALNRIKVRAYELGVEEIHDMALAALRGEGEK